MLSQYSFAYDNSYLNISDEIGPFPAIGSVEEQEDFRQILLLQHSRTVEECSEAEKEANASLRVFFAGAKGPLTVQEAEAATKKLRLLTAKVGTKIFLLKTKYGRLRPYLKNSNVRPCIDLESSKSYPSGHATIARVYAKVLSVAYPERALLLMKRADEVARNRVLGGVHHPSDIEAGKKLGDLLASDYLDNGDNFFLVKGLSSDTYDY